MTRARPESDRGFVMPMVLLLSMVVGITAALLLERMATQDLVVRRQVHNYRMHHFERGAREVVGAWIVSLNQQPLDNMLEEDGHALDLKLADGSVAAVYLFEGQGSLLARPDGLTEIQRDDGAAVVRELWSQSGGEPPSEYFRPVGPLAVSAKSAPEAILRAIGSACGAEGAKFARAIMEKRDAGVEIGDTELTEAINEHLQGEGRDRARRLLTVRPDLWVAVIDVYGPSRSGQKLISRFGGRFTLPGEYNSKTIGSLQSMGPFLSWEELPVDSESELESSLAATSGSASAGGRGRGRDR
jgi:hypothetical protein